HAWRPPERRLCLQRSLKVSASGPGIARSGNRMSMLWRAIAVAAAVLVVVVVAAILALLFLDWNQARGHAEEFLSAAAGREIRIGHLDVEPGWTTTRILLRDLHVANAEWAGEAPLAAVEEARLSVRTWPLLRGQVELP